MRDLSEACGPERFQPLPSSQDDGMEVSSPWSPSANCQRDEAAEGPNAEGPNDSREMSRLSDIMIGPPTSTPIKREDNLPAPLQVDALSVSLQRQLLSETMSLTQQQSLPSDPPRESSSESLRGAISLIRKLHEKSRAMFKSSTKKGKDQSGSGASSSSKLTPEFVSQMLLSLRRRRLARANTGATEEQESEEEELSQGRNDVLLTPVTHAEEPRDPPQQSCETSKRVSTS